MKIRLNFVSNSSSSSYIIVVDKPIKTINDILAFIAPLSPEFSTSRYAKRIFELLKGQEGAFLCNAKSDECNDCTRKFKCFTDRESELVTEWRKWSGIDDNDDDVLFPLTYENELYENNRGKFAYFLMFRDGGEGGDDLEGEMRGMARHILEKIPTFDIT